MEGGDLCMSSVDSRVVDMKFNRNDFAKGVSDTMKQLGDLNSSLKMEGATKGLSDVDDAAKKVDFKNMGDNAEKEGLRIRAMTIFVGTAIATLSHQIFLAGENMVKSLTIAPVISGFQEYELMMGSVQTILANTARYGTTLPQVTAALDELNTYADKTIYDFGEMTKNIGLFTNAGIRVEDATKMIEGFSNVAAASGTNAEGAASAAYQLSQALSAGTIRLMDWRSLQNVGMGNKNMQDGLIDIAKAMGTLSKAGVTAKGVQQDFNGSLEKGWLSSGVMSTYLKIMAGDLTDAQMKTLGLTAEQIKNFDAQQKMAQDAATKVRTFTQLVGTVREAVGSGWTETFRTVFGDFNQATELFTAVNNVVSGIVGSSADARNNMLKDWAKLGGRTEVIKGISNAWHALLDILGPIHDAFREIFPKETGAELAKLSTEFRLWTESLIPSKKTMEDIKRTFAGLFAILDIGWQIVKAGFTFITDLIGHFAKGGGSILGFTGNLGDLIVKFDDFLKKGDIFGKFFDWLEPKIEAPVDALKRFLGFIGGFVKAATSSKIMADTIDRIRINTGELADAGDWVLNVWGHITAVVSALWSSIEPILAKIGGALKTVASDIGHVFSKVSFVDLLGGAGIGGILVMFNSIRKAINRLFEKKSSGPGLLDSVKESLEALTGTLKTMQANLKAAVLIEIATAIGILAIAVSVLSKIDAVGLFKAVTAIGYMAGELVAAFKLMDILLKDAKGMKLDILAAGLILVALAVDVLASAATKMAKLSWNDLAKGLSGVVVLLGAVGVTMRIMPTRESMITNATGILILAEAIKVLASSVQTIADMSWVEIAKGISGVAALLLALGLFNRFGKMSWADVGSGVGLILLATSIKILGSAVKDISQLSWIELAKGMSTMAVALGLFVLALRKLPTKVMLDSVSFVVIAAGMKVLASAIKDLSGFTWIELAKGMSAIAVALGAIVLALRLIPEGAIFSAASLLVAVAAIKILAGAMKDLGGLSWNEIAKSLVELLGSLTLLSVALIAMEGSLPGAAALIVAAGGLVFLAKAMQIMGGMSWSDIAAALVALAGALLVLAVGLTAMIIALPGALALLAAAPGLVALAGALQLLGTLSWGDIGKSIVVLLGIFAALAIGGALSPLIAALGIALVALGVGVAAIGVGFEAGGKGFNEFADGMTKLSQIDSQGIHNVADALQAVIDKIPGLIAAVAVGFVDFAQVIIDNAGTFGMAAAAMLDQMIMVFNQKIPQLVQAMWNGMDAVLKTVDDHLPGLIQKGVDIIVSLLWGIAKNMDRMAAAGTAALIAFMRAIAAYLPLLVQQGADMVIAVLNGIADTIRTRGPELRAAAWNLGTSLIDGIFGGASDPKGQAKVIGAVQGLANNAITAARNALKSKSPSQVFMEIGKDMVEGWAIGVDDNVDTVSTSVMNMGKTIAGLGALVSSQLSDSLTPTITPVLDLTNVQRDASQINQLLQTSPLNMDSTYANAKNASAQVIANQLASLEAASQSGDTFEFTQINQSPKALSTAEIYRNTNNQLSVAKGVLTNAN
jgi:tape measure domain-containing protein